MLSEAAQAIEKRSQLINQQPGWPFCWRKLFLRDLRTATYISKLNSPNLAVQLKAIRALGKIGDGHAVVALLNLNWLNCSSVVSMAIVKALGRLGHKGVLLAIEALINELADWNKDRRESAASELVSIGEPAINLLIRYIKNNERGPLSGRVTAVEVLKKIGGACAEEFLNKGP